MSGLLGYGDTGIMVRFSPLALRREAYVLPPKYSKRNAKYLVEMEGIRVVKGSG